MRPTTWRAWNESRDRTFHTWPAHARTPRSHSNALFGIPAYGGAVGGFLYQPTVSSGCSDLYNETNLSGNIAVLWRGGCTFTRKVRNAQSAGAVGAIVIDDRGVCPSTDGYIGTTLCYSGSRGCSGCPYTEAFPTECQCALRYMADDGDGANVQIPSFIVTSEPGCWREGGRNGIHVVVAIGCPFLAFPVARRLQWLDARARSLQTTTAPSSPNAVRLSAASPRTTPLLTWRGTFRPRTASRRGKCGECHVVNVNLAQVWCTAQPTTARELGCRVCKLTCGFCDVVHAPRTHGSHQLSHLTARAPRCNSRARLRRTHANDAPAAEFRNGFAPYVPFLDRFMRFTVSSATDLCDRRWYRRSRV